MAVRVDIPPLQPFDPLNDRTSIGQRWKSWIKRFETYLLASNITNDRQKRAMLLYQAGTETQEIFETLADTGADYATAKTKLDEYFAPKKNVTYEIFQFRQATQQTGESVEQFATRLRKLAVNCEFGDNVDKEITSAIVQHCLSKRLRRFALRESPLTLENLLAKARSLESSETQATGMEERLTTVPQPDSDVNFVKGHHKKHPTRDRTNTKTPDKRSPSSTCQKCGNKWPHKDTPCPAQGRTCRKCGKPNHFAKMCRSVVTTKRGNSRQKSQTKIQVVNEEESDSSSDDEYAYSTGTSKSKVPMVVVKINGVDIKMVVDTGASTDIVDETAFKQINQDNNISLQASSKRLLAYGSENQLTSRGQFHGTISFQNQQCDTVLHVLKGNHGSLLSYKTATALGILHIQVNHVIDQSSPSLPPETLPTKYPSLFQGIGKIKGVEVKLHIDKEINPIAQQPRRIPFHIRKKVETELNNLEEKGIIERVYGPTPWVSPLVITPKKNGEVRICVDMRAANQAITRERHPLPTVDDLIHTLNGATVFSKLDLRAGYHQIPLAEESRYITTFATHQGLWRYTRLNFGTNSASEIFQKTIQDQLQGITGALNISDDVIVFGKDQAEHDRALDAVCQKFVDMNITLNKKKCEFNKPSVTFFGFVFSGKGIAPDPKKIEAIKNAPAPTTSSGVRSFLGMATYCAKFIPKFSDVSAPLRELTKKDVPFKWTRKQEHSFNEIKRLLTSAQVMAYFDADKETELTTDASPTGLSAILAQRSATTGEKRVVAYISRTLTPVESRYSQTEREALAIVWAVERLHVYLFGNHFKLLTDCKPVQLIISNPKSRPPARIERWNLRLQSYDFEAVHMQGSNNPSDFLSRHSIQEEARSRCLAEEYICFLAANAVPKAMTLEEIKCAVKEDKTLQCLSWLVKNQMWNAIDNLPPEHQGADQTELKLFKKVKDELTVNDESDVVLRNSQIVIPAALRDKAVTLAHEGHQGLTKTKQLMREKVWFPGIDTWVKREIKKCVLCQANSPEKHPDPLQMSQLPPAPWHTVHTDFCGPFPTGEYVLVVIDAYSRFPEVEIVKSTSATTTIPKLERIFATHGIPSVLCSDNGPPFKSHEFKAYTKQNGIKHRKITPLWPQANSVAESFMKPLTKAIRSAHAEGKKWTEHLHEFLLNYRTTPHTTTGQAPATLLFNRQVQNKLPQLTPETPDKALREKDQKAKDRMKQYADTRRRAKRSNIAIGDMVLIRQRKLNKFTTRYDPRPFKVVRVKGSMITAYRDGKYLTRNTSQCKEVEETDQFESDDPESDMDSDIDDNQRANAEQAVTPTLVPPAQSCRRSNRLRNPTQRYGNFRYHGK